MLGTGMLVPIPTKAEPWGVRHFMILTLLLILCLGQCLVLLQINRKRLALKSEATNLTARLDTTEERLRERTELWRIARATQELSAHKHEQTTHLLNETKDYLNSIINSMPSVLIGVTPGGYVTHWNRAAEEATGRPEQLALGYLVDEIYPFFPNIRFWIENAIAQDTVETHESVSMTIAEIPHYYDITVFPLDISDTQGAVIRVDEVTLRVRLENMMIQNEKMLSLGELAAGMAHEINNPLAAIVQSVQNIQRRLQPELARNRNFALQSGLDMQAMDTYLREREIFKFLSGIQEAGTRAAAIVRSMLEFSRGSARLEQQVNLNSITEKAVEYFKNTVSLSHAGSMDDLQLTLKEDPALPAINCNSIEIQQVIVNLLKNAEHAVQSQPPGSRFIRLSTEHTDHEAILSIEDNGCGIDQATLQHIFDPFFTTKEVGEGTGLGLSIAYFIITDRHKGHIDVSSEPGKGTQFTISLPV